MLLEALEPAPLSATQALIAHLRAQPQSALLPAGALAAQFGLSELFVRNILEGLQRPVRPERAEPKHPLSLGFIRQSKTALSKKWIAITAHPQRFIFWSIAFAVILIEVNSTVRSTFGQLAGPRIDPIPIAIILLTFASHLACYYRHAKSRFALQGSVLVWFATSVALMVSVWSSPESRSEPERFGLVLLSAVGMLITGLIYAGFGTLAAVLGSYFRSRAEEHAEDSLSRQQLLERYFELESRLAKSTSAVETDWSDSLTFGKWIRRYPILFAVALSLFLSVLSIVTQNIGGFNSEFSPIESATPVRAVFLLFQSLILITTVGLYASFGLFSRSVWTSFSMWLACVLASASTMFLPFSQYGVEYYRNPSHILTLILGSLVTLVVTLLSHLGGRLQRREAKRRSLQRNDQAAIVAEMLRIQWKLADNTSTVCVMVVDAAKSSEMKASADSLVVEYSFREYQDWLSIICRDLGGRVHSTAGDGAVIAFPTCLNAFHAARQIQTDLARFNREVNRLATPFRLRIGLHVGEVAGSLDEVEFTEVIDIAAHLQGVSPIAGIAVSDRVAMSIPGEDFVPLAKEVDGHQALLAMNPTGT